MNLGHDLPDIGAANAQEAGRWLHRQVVPSIDAFVDAVPEEATASLIGQLAVAAAHANVTRRERPALRPQTPFGSRAETPK